jgi:hypothetical protein
MFISNTIIRNIPARNNTLSHAVHLFATNRMNSGDRSSVISQATRGSRRGDGAAFQTSFQGGIPAEEDTADIVMGTTIAENFPWGVSVELVGYFTALSVSILCSG